MGLHMLGVRMRSEDTVTVRVCSCVCVGTSDAHFLRRGKEHVGIPMALAQIMNFAYNYQPIGTQFYT